MFNQEELVSIIVPIYNVECFVSKCIESICKQTYQNIEVILIDDGSKDNSGAICDMYAQKDTRITVIHKKNSGVSEARNCGISHAHGKYICFVDGDDYIMPDYVEYLLSMIKENDAQISMTLQMFGNYDNQQTKKDKINIWTGEEAVEAILCYRVPIGCYCKLFRKDIIENIRFLPELFIGEGFNFNISAFQNANRIVTGTHKIYYYRRDNPTSAMTKFSIDKCECGIKALKVIHDNLIIHTRRIENAWKYANWRTHSDFYDMCVLAKVKKECSEMYQKCLKITKKEALIALQVPTTRKNKIRAVIMHFCPMVIPVMMKIRKVRYHVYVSNR